MPESTDPTPAAAEAPVTEQPLVTPEPVPGLPLSDATIEEAPAAAEPSKVVRSKPHNFIEPRVGQRVCLHVPERKTASGKPIPVLRPGTPSRPYQSGDVVRWDNHFVNLRSEGAVLATEIVE